MRALVPLIAAQLLICDGLRLNLYMLKNGSGKNIITKIMNKIKGTSTYDEELNYDLEKERDITKRMVELASSKSKLMDKTCRRFVDKDVCEASVRLYMERCSKNECMNLDYEEHPLTESETHIHLPNVYQLEVAYNMFNIFIKEYRVGNIVNGKKLKSKQKSNFYRIFMAALVRNNLSFSGKQPKDVDVFLSRYLYMAVLYYKTYTTLEPIKTNFQNYISISRPLFISRLRGTLTNIILANMNQFKRDTRANHIIHMTKDIPVYITIIQPGIKRFAEVYSVVVVDTLINTLSKIALDSQVPMYRRAKKLLKGIVKRLLPTVPNPFKIIMRKLRGKEATHLEKPFEDFVSAASSLT